MLAVETDEFAHRGYDPRDEDLRYHELLESIISLIGGRFVLACYMIVWVLCGYLCCIGAISRDVTDFSDVHTIRQHLIRHPGF